MSRSSLTQIEKIILESEKFAKEKTNEIRQYRIKSKKIPEGILLIIENKFGDEDEIDFTYSGGFLFNQDSKTKRLSRFPDAPEDQENEFFGDPQEIIEDYIDHIEEKTNIEYVGERKDY